MEVSMKQTIYDNDVVCQHPFYQKYEVCRSTLNGISQKDYPGTQYFDTKIEAIDVDNYEHYVLNQQNSVNTVDAAIGVSDFDGNRMSSERLQMIELKINVHSLNRKFFSDCEKKVSHSRNILVWSKPIDKIVYFVFDKDYCEQARRIFESIKHESKAVEYWVSVSYEELKEFIKDKNSVHFPYVPKYNMSGEFERFRKIPVSDIDAHIDILDKWIENARSFIVHYDYPEAQNICDGLSQMLTFMLNCKDVDLQECAKMYSEELNSLLSSITNN